nr:hypothetical protein [Tanacetum cinerariifolium]
QQTHISQLGGSGTDEGTGSKPGVPNVPTDESEEELSWNSSDDECLMIKKRDEESFDPIPKTPESSEDEGNGEEDQGLRISEEERLNEEAEAEELYRDQEISSVSSHFVTSMLNPPSDADRLKSLEASFSEYRQTNPFAEAVSNIPGIVHQYINQQMLRQYEW